MINKEQHDLAWACLPKDKRAEFKEIYLNNNVGDRIYNTYDCGYTNALKDIFGEHKLTSDTEPEEMLMVERKYIQEMYADGVGTHYLLNLFGDKCLPDKEEHKQKYVLQAELRLFPSDGRTVEDYECVEVNMSDIDLTKVAEAVKETLEKFHSKVAQSK